MYDIHKIQAKLEHAQLAGNIYQQDNILVLQAPYQDDGSALNVFAQHEHTTEQIGLQFGIQVFADHIDYLIGLTFSNQDKHYEISAGNLKGDQSAFNLIYAFYNFPKSFFLARTSLSVTSSELENVLEQQLFSQADLSFIQTTIKTNPLGEQIQWIKAFIIQQSLEMKVRLQMAI